MNREELFEKRTHVRRLISEVNNARMRDLQEEKRRHNAQLRDEYELHALKVSGIEEEFAARMNDLKAQRDWLSMQVPDDVQEGGAE